MAIKFSSEEFLQVSYDPLSFAVAMRELGGSVKQVYYTDSNVYMPNRKLTPLVLVPEVMIVDPEKIIPSGDVASQLVSARWYVGSISAITQITVYEDDSEGSTADYALSRTYKPGLLVRKNVEQTRPVLLLFQGEYYDSRRRSNILVTGASLLSTTSNAESVATPIITLDKPAAWIFNPLKGISNQTVNAFMFRGGDQVADANIAWFWYKVENGVESLINPNDDLFYVSGKNADGTWSSSIVLNPDYMEKVHIRCKADYYEDNRPSTPTQGNMAETIFKRRFPHSLKFDTIIRTGTLVKEGKKIVIAECQPSTNDSIIKNPGEFFFMKCFKKEDKPGAQEVEIGHGSLVTYDQSSALGGTLGVKFRFEGRDHGAYKKMIDNNGNVFTDKDGRILVWR